LKQIPNLLSLARVVLAPYLFYLLWQGEYRIALAVILICGVTDGLDGLAARRFNANSRVGAYLDPIADKILLSGAFITLALRGTIETWLAVVVLGRDVFILAMVAAGFLLTSIRSFPPTFSGKASTTAQIIFILLLIMHLAGWIGPFLVVLEKWITVGWAVLSGVEYAVRGISQLRRPAVMMKE
jgi:cardiolipin synthase